MKINLLMLATLWASFLQAYVYEIRIMAKWDPAHRKNIYAIGLSDFHDKLEPANEYQRAFLHDLLDQSNRYYTKVIVEDLSSANILGNAGYNQYSLNSRRGILASLAQECAALGFGVDNIEYRFSRVIALGGLISQAHESPYRFSPACTIRIGALLEEVKKIMAHVQEFTDSPSLQRWYKQACAQAADALKALKFDISSSLSCAAYVDKASVGIDRMSLLKHMLTFDSALIDCLIVHSIVRSYDKDRIVAIAGGTHITRAFDQLAKEGFKDIYATQIEYNKDFDVNNAIGSPILPGGYSLKPVPIGLDVLTQYLAQ